MPYCKIEVDDQRERPKTDSLSKDQSVLVKLDAIKFKNIPPEKAEGGFSNQCLQIALCGFWCHPILT